MKGETMLGMCGAVNLVNKSLFTTASLVMNKLCTSAYIFMNKMHLVFRLVMCKPRNRFLKPAQNIPENMVKNIFLTTLKKIKIRNLECLHTSEPLKHQQTQYSKTLANSNYKANRTYTTNITDSHIIII